MESLFDNDELFNNNNSSFEDNIKAHLNSMLKLKPSDFKFYERLLPFAITNNEISADDLIDLWIFVQHKGDDQATIESVFIDDDSDEYETSCLVFNILEEERSEDILNLIQKPIKYVRERENELKMIDYYTDEEAKMLGVRRHHYDKMPEKERKLIDKYQKELYNKLVPSVDKAQLKTLWEEADANNQIELMFYYFFLDKYLRKHAEEAVLNTSNWPSMAQLKKHILPEYNFDEIFNNLKLLSDISYMRSEGYENSKWTFSNILGFLEIVKLIRDNQIE